MTTMLLMAVPVLPLLMALLCLNAQGARLMVPGAPLAVVPALFALLLPDIEAPVPGLLLDARLLLDDTARIFLAFTATLWAAATVYARSQLAEDARRARFFSFLLATMAGNLGLIVAGDALGFYLWFTLMSLAAYGLIVHDGDDAARRAGRAYMVLVVIGEVLLFAGVVLHGARTGSTGFTDMAAVPMTPLAALLLLAAFGVKAGAMPLHMWLPLAHPAAPIPASAVLSGAMIKAGLLGWLRFLPPDQGLPGTLSAVAIGIGLAGAFLGVLLGLAQSRAKTVLAYSSISQIGIMLLGLGLAWRLPELAPMLVAAVLLTAVHHALAKGALFLGVGVVYATAHRGPLLWLALALPGLTLAGLPLSSGAAAKLALKDALESAPNVAWLLAVLPVAAVGTMLLIGRYLWLLRRIEGRPGPLPAAMLWPWLALVFAGPLVAWGWQPAREAGLAALTVPAFLTALGPVAFGIALALWVARAPPRRAPAIPEGDLWTLFERLASAAGLGVQRLRSLRWRPRLAWPRSGLSAASTRLEGLLAREPVPGVLMILLALAVFGLLRI